MIQPDFREFQRLAKLGNLIPVYDVFSADLLTPVSAYLRIAQGARYSFLLESVEGGEKIGRYTFAGAHPEAAVRRNRIVRRRADVLPRADRVRSRPASSVDCPQRVSRRKRIASHK